MTGSLDTIFAPASGQGRAAIAVIRLSGPHCGATLDALTRGGRPEPRRAALRRLVDPADSSPLDQALVLWMPGPASFTGEDQAELHVHGGQAVRAAVLRVLADRPGLRPAEPGEFARRAFLSGRLDLSGAEGLADLIDAETEAQRRQALRQVEGALACRVADWRERLIDLSALVEAGLDFTDEDDVPDDVAAGIGPGVSALRRDIASELAKAGAGERLREGCTIVIAGPPNAGKSTLLNALARRDVAIVSPLPGTTRDAIEVRCDLAGWPVTFVDTAGLRESADPIEQQGIARARARAERADLVLWLQPADRASGAAPPEAARWITVRTKADLHPVHDDELAVSALTGSGMERLIATVREAIGAGAPSDALVTRERHRLALTHLAEALGRAETAAAAGQDDLAAEDLRLGLRALGQITGAVDVEIVLDRVFSQFCIGK